MADNNDTLPSLANSDSWLGSSDTNSTDSSDSSYYTGGYTSDNGSDYSYFGSSDNSYSDSNYSSSDTPNIGYEDTSGNMYNGNYQFIGFDDGNGNPTVTPNTLNYSSEQSSQPFLNSYLNSYDPNGNSYNQTQQQQTIGPQFNTSNPMNSNGYMQTLSQFGNMFSNALAKQSAMNQQMLGSAVNKMNSLTDAQVKLGQDQLGIQKQYLSLAQERWQMTKDEMNRIKSLREKLTQQYLS